MIEHVHTIRGFIINYIIKDLRQSKQIGQEVASGIVWDVGVTIAI